MTTAPPSRRPLRLQRRVAGPPDRVFPRFLDGVDQWWRHGPRFRRFPRGHSRMRFTEQALVEVGPEQTVVVARVVARRPPRRLELLLDGAAVVVEFEAVGEDTLVTVVHARPLDGRTAFQDPMAAWWAELLAGLAPPPRPRAPRARVPDTARVDRGQSDP